MRSHKKFGLDRFSRFDVYWTKQTDKQSIYIEVTCNLCSGENEESCQNSTLLKRNYMRGIFRRKASIKQVLKIKFLKVIYPLFISKKLAGVA